MYFSLLIVCFQTVTSDTCEIKVEICSVISLALTALRFRSEKEYHLLDINKTRDKNSFEIERGTVVTASSRV